MYCIYVYTQYKLTWLWVKLTMNRKTIKSQNNKSSKNMGRLTIPHSCQSGLWYRRTPQSDPEPWECWAWWCGKWNESGFRPPLCTYRLNWDDTALQTQDSKFKPWRSEAEHATQRRIQHRVYPAYAPPPPLLVKIQQIWTEFDTREWKRTSIPWEPQANYMAVVSFEHPEHH